MALAFILAMIGLGGVYIVYDRYKSRAPKAPPAPSPEQLDDEWMIVRYPVGSRISYLGKMLAVSHHNETHLVAEYVDDHGCIREIVLYIGQLRAIAQRDEPKSTFAQ